MGELVGLGLRGIGKSAINIDLVPMVVEQSRAADRRKPFLIAAAAVLLGGMAIWAVFQNVAAAKAKEEMTRMEDRRKTLAPLKADIDQLLKKEDNLRQVASGYTDSETAHVYWLDVLAELRGAFASDAVWLTDFEPLYDYNPPTGSAKIAGGKPDSKLQSGKSVIKNDFATATYGTSSLIDLKVEEAPVQGKRGAPAIPAGVTANAVRIKGFWRTSTSQNVVSELLKNLREKSSTFRFMVKNDKGADVVLSDPQILDITVTGKAGELGLPFEITLPLAREVAIK